MNMVLLDGDGNEKPEKVEGTLKPGERGVFVIKQVGGQK